MNVQEENFLRSATGISKSECKLLEEIEGSSPSLHHPVKCFKVSSSLLLKKKPVELRKINKKSLPLYYPLSNLI